MFNPLGHNITTRLWMAVLLLSTAMGVSAQAFRTPMGGSSGSGETRSRAETIAYTRALTQSYSWSIIPPLGLRTLEPMDTLLLNYYRQAIPSEVSDAYATTGNTASPGLNMIYMERPAMSDFFFSDAYSAWVPSLAKWRFYNTRIPITLLSYNFGGGRDNGQDRLRGIFSGNAGPRWQVGAMVDYIYSKGSYANQAAKDLTWGAEISHTGERYGLQAFIYHYNNLNMDNGGITDPLYITDPAQLQGGQSAINPKSIPTRLDAARTRLKGTQVYVNNRYNLGHWHTERDDTAPDSVPPTRSFVPVASIIHTLDYRDGKHRFTNNNSRQAHDFWQNFYLDPDKTLDYTTYWSLSNTVGISMLEGFSRYWRFGLSAFATYQITRYNQTPVELSETPSEALTPLPVSVPERGTENNTSIGAQLTKQRGNILTYEATAQLGITGAVAGDFDARGSLSTRFRLGRDSIGISAFGAFANTHAPYLMKHYLSNHFAWDNDFGHIRTLRLGGSITVPQTGTILEAKLENVQNHIYFGSDGLPRQEGGNVQVFAASLRQQLHLGILHWDNSITYQTTSRSDVIPMPRLAVYSNLYLLFKVARVLNVQLGIDCDYYTRYNAPTYQPATTAFCVQTAETVGNYPFIDFYINMKLSKARFYLLFSHVNQGMCGRGYFSMPLYPLNPRRFQLGVSVDFAN